MIKGLLVLAVFLLCLFGLANLIWAILLWLSRNRGSRKPTLVILLPRHSGEVESAMRNALFEAESIGYRRCSGLIAVDDRLPPDCRAIAEAFCESHDGILLCDSKNLSDRLALLRLTAPRSNKNRFRRIDPLTYRWADHSLRLARLSQGKRPSSLSLVFFQWK